MIGKIIMLEKLLLVEKEETFALSEVNYFTQTVVELICDFSSFYLLLTKCRVTLVFIFRISIF